MDTEKTMYVGMRVLIVLIFIFLGYTAYLQFYPFKTLVVNGATAKTTSIKAGDVFVYTVDYCKFTDKPATVFRTLHSVDETNSIPFPVVSTISRQGCHAVDVPLQTYPTIPAGQYYLLVNVVFKVNSQREINVVFKTNSFQIN